MARVSVITQKMLADLHRAAHQGEPSVKQLLEEITKDLEQPSEQPPRKLSRQEIKDRLLAQREMTKGLEDPGFRLSEEEQQALRQLMAEKGIDLEKVRKEVEQTEASLRELIVEEERMQADLALIDSVLNDPNNTSYIFYSSQRKAKDEVAQKRLRRLQDKRQIR
jgi:hypothetical protein